MSPRHRFPFSLLTLGMAVLAPLAVHGAEEQASGAAAQFGIAVSLSGTTGLIGADETTVGSHYDQGAAFVFRSLDTATGTVTQSAKLAASDGGYSSLFGSAVSLAGTTGLIGADGAAVGSSNQGAAYVFRGLDTATGTVTQDAKLIASDGASSSYFGYAVSLTGGTGLVGAYGAKIGGNSNQGAAYVYRGLNTATGTNSQNAKLVASGGAANDDFGYAVSLSGSTGLVGAYGTKVGSNAGQGTAYLYRNLDTASGTVTENVKLVASDGATGDLLGTAVSLSGSTALVGAENATVGMYGSRGAAYVYRNLDAVANGGTVTENVKLIASDGMGGNYFGIAVSLSGSTGLVGAYGTKVGSNAGQGTAYLYRNLDTANGTVTENVELVASDGAANSLFGSAVSLDGDRFLVGAFGANKSIGKSYSGTVSSMTTLDAGNATGLISGVSFVSQDNWVVGQNTSGNQVTLGKGDTANVTALGKSVSIGQNAGSSNNTLLVQSTVKANTIMVSSAAGATGNTLQIANDGGTTTAGTVSATGGITVNAGGTVLLSGSGAVTDRIGNSTALTLAGGTFNLGGLSEGEAGTDGLSVIRLTLTSTMDFGALGGANLVQFTGLGGHTLGAQLLIVDWEGTPGRAGGMDRLLIGGLATNFVASYLPTEVSFNGIGGYGVTQYNGYYEVYGLAAAPEPSTWTMLGLSGAGLLGLVFYQRRARRA